MTLETNCSEAGDPGFRVPSQSCDIKTSLGAHSMIQQAIPDAIRPGPLPTQVPLALTLGRSLDRLTLPPYLSTIEFVSVVGCFENVEEVLAATGTLAPEAVLIDISSDSAPAIGEAMAMRGRGAIRAILAIDDHWSPAHARQVLSQAGGFYLSRSDNLLTELDAVRMYLLQSATGIKVSPPKWHIAKRNQKEESLSGIIRGRDRYGYESLSDREREVMTLLAEGRTVKQIAHSLSLSESTIDNHKVRLMHKLNVSKAASLTRLAIHFGMLGHRLPQETLQYDGDHDPGRGAGAGGTP